MQALKRFFDKTQKHTLIATFHSKKKKLFLAELQRTLLVIEGQNRTEYYVKYQKPPLNSTI